jgi:hypothetical protein
MEKDVGGSYDIEKMEQIVLSVVDLFMGKPDVYVDSEGLQVPGRLEYLEGIPAPDRV